MTDKFKWFAATGYILVLIDTFCTQLFDFYQFQLFGYYINLVTLTPLVIFYSINKSHPELFISSHLKRSISIYFTYIIWSVVSGVFFESNNLWFYIAGIGITFLMIIVMLYVAFSCGKGIIRVFKSESISGKTFISQESETQANESV